MRRQKWQSNNRSIGLETDDDLELEDVDDELSERDELSREIERRGAA